jgi:hypothetical protein
MTSTLQRHFSQQGKQLMHCRPNSDLPLVKLSSPDLCSTLNYIFDLTCCCVFAMCVSCFLKLACHRLLSAAAATSCQLVMTRLQA